MVSARTAPTMALTGWLAAMGCNQLGMDSTGT